MPKFVFAIPIFFLAIFLVACESKNIEDRINGVWQSEDAGKYFKVLLTIDTKAKKGTLAKYDGDDVVMTHTEKIEAIKASENSATLDMESEDGTKSQITLTFDGNKLLLTGSGQTLSFIRAKK